jgi:hypothetical protein
LDDLPVSLTSIRLERCCGGDLSRLTALQHLALDLSPSVTLATLPLPPSLTFLSLGSLVATEQQVETFWGPPGAEVSLYQCAGLEHLQVGFCFQEENAPRTRLSVPAGLTRLTSLRSLLLSVKSEDDKSRHEIAIPELSSLTRLTSLRLWAAESTVAGQAPPGCIITQKPGKDFGPLDSYIIVFI